MSKDKLFISYALKDKELADALVDLLVGGTTLKSSDVVYSSLKEREALDGGGFSTYIESEIKTPTVAIVLLSPSYFSKRLSLCEMGAVLARSKYTLPVLVPPLDYKHLKGLFELSHVDKIDSTDDLNRFVAELKKQMESVELNLPQWAMKKKQFLASLPSILDRVSVNTSGD